MKRSSLLLLVWISFLISVTSCKEKKEPWSILEFKGAGVVANYSKSYMTIFHETDSSVSNSILASRGDLILYGENSLTIFSQNSGTLFSFKADKEYGYINGKIRCISIPEKADQLPAFLKSDTTDLSQLELIAFGSKITKSHVPLLTHLSKISPDAGLSFEDGLENLPEILKLFDPKFILAGNVPLKDYDLLSGEPNLETLLLAVEEPIDSTPLPAMAKLEQLIIAGSDDGSLTGDQFFAKNSQIKRLSVISLGAFDCAVLKSLKNLKELMIFDCDTVLNTDIIKEQKGLEVLVPCWKDFRYEITLEDLPELRWITFTNEVPQTVFELFIGSNPNLEVVEIINNDKIRNLQSLQTLKKLYGLTVVDTLTDLNSLTSLKSLKYLSLPEDVVTDSIKKEILRQALPGTVIASNEGVCLGSGWLLVLIPLVILFRFVSGKKNN